jgi:ABC-type antimicrobial peptide transport system permease subunit
LLIAAVGIYGMTSYMVTRRTVEIGIRMSLGADPRDVIGMLIRESIVPVAGGLGFGIVASWGLGRFVAAILFGITGHDPWAIAGAGAFLLLVAGVAAAVPSLAASRLDPLRALRYE